jgi:ribonuclease BN (tRNA processing enzyme)
LLQWKYSRRKRPIRIIGPADTQKLASEIAQTVYPGLLDVRYEIEWEELAPGASARIGDLDFETLEMKHDDRLSGTLGFAAKLGGRAFGYTGDSAMCDSVMDLARHSEVLVSECASRGENLDVHMNMADDMPVVRAAMDREAKLILTHLGPGVDGTGLKDTIVAREGAHYRF